MTGMVVGEVVFHEAVMKSTKMAMKWSVKVKDSSEM